jgi:hypothetical protein
MSIVIKFVPKDKAKADMKAALEKGKTKAKTATTPASKQKIAAKIKEKLMLKASLQSPTILARCRMALGGDLSAAALLSAISVKWTRINPKIEWQGRDWLVMSAEDCRASAGGETALRPAVFR